MPSNFLVAYDYGMGGLWAVVTAESATAITSQFPEVQVVTERPAWLDDEQYARLERLHLDDDPSAGLFRAILADRGRG